MQRHGDMDLVTLAWAFGIALVLRLVTAGVRRRLSGHAQLAHGVEMTSNVGIIVVMAGGALLSAGYGTGLTSLTLTAFELVLLAGVVAVGSQVLHREASPVITVLLGLALGLWLLSLAFGD